MERSKDVLFQGGWRSLIRPLIVIGIMGIYLPLQLGPQWVALTPIAMLLLLWIPFFVIISFIGDAIAGERGGAYLENLLAGPHARSSDLAGESNSYCPLCLGHGRAQFILGLVLVDLFRTQGDWMFYPLDLFVDALVLILLASVLAASAGVLISLKVATVRQAQQILSIGTIVFVFGIVFILQAIPANVVSSLSYSKFCYYNGVYCPAGCDLAWIITDQFPTFAFNLELRKYIEIKYYYYPQGWCILNFFEDRLWISIPHKRSMKMTPQPNAVPPIPEGCSTVMPWIISRDTARLLDFMKQAFGAQELSRMYNEDGTIGHAEVKIGDSIVGGFDADEGWPDIPCFLRLYVEDADAVYQQALSAGAISVTEMTSLIWGGQVVVVCASIWQRLVHSNPRRECQFPGDGKARNREAVSRCQAVYPGVS